MKKHVHNVHFWLVGALLHTSFNSRTRPWELRSVDGIDLFDVFGSSIRYETRKNGLMRAISSTYSEKDTILNFSILSDLFLEVGVKIKDRKSVV